MCMLWVYNLWYDVLKEYYMNSIVVNKNQYLDELVTDEYNKQ